MMTRLDGGRCNAQEKRYCLREPEQDVVLAKFLIREVVGKFVSGFRSTSEGICTTRGTRSCKPSLAASL
eukprot:11193104-Lingulodinium_polyedra.AAC.1